MRTVALTWLLAMLLSAQTGCRTPNRRSTPDPQRAASASAPTTQNAGPSADRLSTEALFRAAQSVLRDRGFKFAQVNARRHRLVTYPVVSQHFFEFWRRDVVGFAAAMEASALHLRRFVRLAVNPTASGPRLDLAAYKQQLSSPERQFNNSGSAYHFFSKQLPAMHTGARIQPRDEVWIDVGQDHELERVLTQEILATARAGQDRPLRDDAREPDRR